VFAVLEDNDAEKLQALGYADASSGLGDAAIEKLVAERQAARQRRDFAASDRIARNSPSVVYFWKMPRTAASAGNANEVLPLS